MSCQQLISLGFASHTTDDFLNTGRRTRLTQQTAKAGLQFDFCRDRCLNGDGVHLAKGAFFGIEDLL